MAELEAEEEEGDLVDLDREARRRNLVRTGFKEGAADGRQRGASEGAVSGFASGAQSGYEYGQARGALCALRVGLGSDGMLDAVRKAMAVEGGTLELESAVLDRKLAAALLLGVGEDEHETWSAEGGTSVPGRYERHVDLHEEEIIPTKTAGKSGCESDAADDRKRKDREGHGEKHLSAETLRRVCSGITRAVDVVSAHDSLNRTDVVETNTDGAG